MLEHERKWQFLSFIQVAYIYTRPQKVPDRMLLIAFTHLRCEMGLPATSQGIRLWPAELRALRTL